MLFVFNSRLKRREGGREGRRKKDRNKLYQQSGGSNLGNKVCLPDKSEIHQQFSMIFMSKRKGREGQRKKKKKKKLQK